MTNTQPFLMRTDGSIERGGRLPRVHDRFDERRLQDLLADHPELLPVSLLRPDAGELVCIGREVPTGDGGWIDNLYLTTGGYVVIVETKLWRNPESRREVFAQVLDYVKDVVTRDFEWLSSTWTSFCRARSRPAKPLVDVIGDMLKGVWDESGPADFTDRVQRALERGHVIALIVGDGIQTRLQNLVSYLCQTSAHLRYSLGLVSLRFYQLPGSADLLVLPELVQDVEPVQRAWVRIEVPEVLAGQIRVTSAMEEASGPVRSASRKRTTLTEEELYEALTAACGPDASDQVRSFIGRLTAIGIETDYKSAAVMLKVPDPSGEGWSASLLAFDKTGSVYNPGHGWNQVLRWGWSEDAVRRTIGRYWERLHDIDERFSLEGMDHTEYLGRPPIKDVLPKLEAIYAALHDTIEQIDREAALIEASNVGRPDAHLVEA